MTDTGPGRHGFTTAGYWCVDRNKTVAFRPAEDQAAVVLDTELSGGGSACNFAMDMKRLDPTIPVETIGLVGDDQDGRYLIAAAEAAGIGHSQLQITAQAPTASTDAFQSQRSGRRTHIAELGTASLLCPDHFDLDAARGRIFHLGLPGLQAAMDAPWGDDPNGWVTVLKRAQAESMRTNLELVSVERENLLAIVRPCLPHLDYLIVNDFEIGAITGIATVRDGRTDAKACAEAARTALGQGSMDLTVVHYVDGADLIARDGTSLHVPSVNIPDNDYRGANGAGDAFAAGFLYAHHEQWDLEACMRLAHASAASCLRSTTTSGGVDRASQCLQRAQRWGWR